MHALALRPQSSLLGATNPASGRLSLVTFRTWRSAALPATTLALLLAACGGAVPGSTSPAPAAPRTSAEASMAAWDGPMGIEGLQAYGAQHADTFGGLYLDPPGGNSVTILFTDDLERHATAVLAIHPATRVLQVEHTEAELTALLESLDFQAMAGQGIDVVSGSVDVIDNVVELEVKSNDPTAELRLEAAHAGQLDVTVHPVPGPWAHAEAGDGWRLLTAGQAGGDEAFTVRAATDQAELRELWDALAIGGDLPAADLDDEVVVSFAHGIGSSCSELRLDDVVVRDGVVFSVTSDPLAPRGCTADLVGAVVFVVAVQRAALPADGFTLQLAATNVTCGAECGSTEQIEVELP